MSEQRIFILRLTGREKTSFKEDIVGIGWSKARGLDAVKDWEAFKQIIHQAYPHYSNYGLGNVGGSIWNFIHEIDKGDLIVVPLAGSFKVAEVLEDSPYYDKSGYKDDYAWRRNVKWLTDQPVPRSYASNTLQRRLKCRQTCIDMSTLSEHLQAALQRNSPISFKDELYTDSRPVVFRHLLDSVTDIQLETLIEEIYLAQGYDAKRLPKKQQQDGDVDVRVEIDTGLGADSKPLAIGIQVKQHEGMTDKYAVQQIAARLGDGGTIDRGIVVTTAADFDDEAKKLAEEHDIALVSRDELANWILDNLGNIGA